MKPTRDDDAVVDLLDVVLRDGVVVNADVIVTVGDVPLIGINLRAAVAGMTTMTEHGLLDDRRRVAEDAPATVSDGTEAEGTVRPAESK